MSPDQQVALYNQMTLEYLLNGTTYSPNSGFDGVTVTQNADGTFAVTVSGTVFSNRKTLFQQKSPGMVSGGSSFYPAEAELVIYSVAAGDMGWSNDTLATIKSNIASATGLDMSTRSLFGNQGYLARRPLGQFGDETAMAQLFSDLGF